MTEKPTHDTDGSRTNRRHLATELSDEESRRELKKLGDETRDERPNSDSNETPSGVSPEDVAKYTVKVEARRPLAEAWGGINREALRVPEQQPETQTKMSASAEKLSDTEIAAAVRKEFERLDRESEEDELVDNIDNKSELSQTRATDGEEKKETKEREQRHGGHPAKQTAKAVPYGVVMDRTQFASPYGTKKQQRTAQRNMDRELAAARAAIKREEVVDLRREQEEVKTKQLPVKSEQTEATELSPEVPVQENSEPRNEVDTSEETPQNNAEDIEVTPALDKPAEDEKKTKGEQDAVETDAVEEEAMGDAEVKEESQDVEDADEKPVQDAEHVARVPLMITQATRAELQEHGVSKNEIKKMTPEQALARLEELRADDDSAEEGQGEVQEDEQSAAPEETTEENSFEQNEGEEEEKADVVASLEQEVEERKGQLEKDWEHRTLETADPVIDSYDELKRKEELLEKARKGIGEEPLAASGGTEEEEASTEMAITEKGEGRDTLGEAYQEARQRYKEYRNRLDTAEDSYHDAVAEYEEFRKGSGRWEKWTSSEGARKKEKMEEAQVAYDELLEETRERREERMQIFQSVLAIRENDRDRETKEVSTYNERVAKYASLHEAILERQVDDNVLMMERVKLSQNEDNESQNRYVRGVKATWDAYRKMPVHKKIGWGIAAAGGAGFVAGGLGIVGGGALGLGAAWGARRAVGGTVGMGAAIGTKLGGDKLVDMVEEKRMDKQHGSFSKKSLKQSTEERLSIRKGTRIGKRVSTGAAAAAAVTAGASASSIADQMADGTSFADVDKLQGVKNLGDRVKWAFEKTTGAEEVPVSAESATPTTKVLAAEEVVPQKDAAVPEEITNANEEIRVDSNGDHYRMGTSVESTAETEAMHDEMYEMLNKYFGDSPESYEQPQVVEAEVPVVPDEVPTDSVDKVDVNIEPTEPVPAVEEVKPVVPEVTEQAETADVPADAEGAEAATKTIAFKGTYEAGSSVQRELQQMLKSEYPELTKLERGNAAHLIQLELAKNPGAAEAFGVEDGEWNNVVKGATYEFDLDRATVEEAIHKVEGRVVSSAESLSKQNTQVLEKAADYVESSPTLQDLSPAEKAYAAHMIQAESAAVGDDSVLEISDEKLQQVRNAAVQEVSRSSISKEQVPQAVEDSESGTSNSTSEGGPRAGDFAYRDVEADLAHAGKVLGPDYRGEQSLPAIERLFKTEGMFNSDVQSHASIIKSQWGPISHVPLRNLIDIVDGEIVRDATPGVTYNIDGTELQLNNDTERLLRSMLVNIEIASHKVAPGVDAMEIIKHGHKVNLTVGDMVQTLAEKMDAEAEVATSTSVSEPKPNVQQESMPDEEPKTLSATETAEEKHVEVEEKEVEPTSEKRPTGKQRANAFEGHVAGAADVPIPGGEVRVGGVVDADYGGTGNIETKYLGEMPKDQSIVSRADKTIRTLYFRKQTLPEWLSAGEYHPTWESYDGSAADLMTEDQSYADLVNRKLSHVGGWVEKGRSPTHPIHYELSDADKALSPKELLVKLEARALELKENPSGRNQTGWRKTDSQRFKFDYKRK